MLRGLLDALELLRFRRCKLCSDVDLNIRSGDPGDGNRGDGSAGDGSGLVCVDEEIFPPESSKTSVVTDSSVVIAVPGLTCSTGGVGFSAILSSVGSVGRTAGTLGTACSSSCFETGKLLFRFKSFRGFGFEIRRPRTFLFDFTDVGEVGRSSTAVSGFDPIAIVFFVVRLLADVVGLGRSSHEHCV